MYGNEMTEASKSALLELGLSLGQYRNDIVLTGGWAPYFITHGFFQHCGSIDIDLALKTEILQKYEKIRTILETLGYVEDRNPFRFSRWIQSPIDGKKYQMHLDLLCEKEGITHVYHLREVQEDLMAHVFDGVSLAFDFNFEQEIETYLPENGKAKTTFKVVDLVGSLALKANALVGRHNIKDSYDIFALTHYHGGTREAAKYFNKKVAGTKISPINRELLARGLTSISYNFQDQDQRGPFDVESFSEMKYKRNIVASQVNQFLRSLHTIS